MIIHLNKNKKIKQHPNTSKRKEMSKSYERKKLLNTKVNDPEIGLLETIVTDEITHAVNSDFNRGVYIFRFDSERAPSFWSEVEVPMEWLMQDDPVPITVNPKNGRAGDFGGQTKFEFKVKMEQNRVHFEAKDKNHHEFSFYYIWSMEIIGGNN